MTVYVCVRRHTTNQQMKSTPHSQSPTFSAQHQTILSQILILGEVVRQRGAILMPSHISPPRQNQQDLDRSGSWSKPLEGLLYAMS